MKLWEIPAAIESLIDPETGAITDPAALEALNMERERKIEYLALLAKNAAAMETALKAEAAELTARANREAARQESLKAYLKTVLGGKGFETAKCKVSFRKTPEAVKISTDPSVLIGYLKETHPESLRYKDPEINKTVLKEVLKSGGSIPGVTLESGVSISIK